MPCALPQAYELRNAGAVIHGHSINAFLATLLDPEASEFRCTHIEMIKVGQGGGRQGESGAVCASGMNAVGWGWGWVGVGWRVY